MKRHVKLFEDFELDPGDFLQDFGIDTFSIGTINTAIREHQWKNKYSKKLFTFGKIVELPEEEGRQKFSITLKLKHDLRKVLIQQVKKFEKEKEKATNPTALRNYKKYSKPWEDRLSWLTHAVEVDPYCYTNWGFTFVQNDDKKALHNEKDNWKGVILYAWANLTHSGRKKPLVKEHKRFLGNGFETYKECIEDTLYDFERASVFKNDEFTFDKLHWTADEGYYPSWYVAKSYHYQK